MDSYIYLLLADGDGMTFSRDTPFGVAVDTEEEAKKFVREGGVGYSHSYQKIRVFSSKDNAIHWRFHRE